MASESTLTTRKFLDVIFEQIRPHADNPEEFASEWERITGELDSRVKNLECFMSKRDDLARELILLMRTQFANSYLFDDLWLQYSQGCSVLSDYAELLSDPELDRNKGGVSGVDTSAMASIGLGTKSARCRNPWKRRNLISTAV